MNLEYRLREEAQNGPLSQNKIVDIISDYHPNVDKSRIDYLMRDKENRALVDYILQERGSHGAIGKTIEGVNAASDAILVGGFFTPLAGIHAPLAVLGKGVSLIGRAGYDLVKGIEYGVRTGDYGAIPRKVLLGTAASIPVIGEGLTNSKALRLDYSNLAVKKLNSIMRNEVEYKHSNRLRGPQVAFA